MKVGEGGGTAMGKGGSPVLRIFFSLRYSR